MDRGRFVIRAPQAGLDDLASRLRRTRWPPQLPTGWVGGVEAAYLRSLVRYWQDQFDWRRQESAINRHVHHRVEVDGLPVHFVLVPGRGPAPLPLVLSHGWPSSFLEFLPVVGMLSDPEAHGGDPADAFDVVVPSLPGFGFTAGPAGHAVVRRAPRLWATLMTDVLGYRRFGAHGTDIGAFVTNRLALDHPQVLVGAHVTAVAEPWLGAGSAALTAAEEGFVRRRTADHETAQAYAHLQRTTPVTVGYALHDSPVGLAAWIVEKWRSWSDCGGDVESRFSKDQLLSTITLYWLTGTAVTSAHAYADLALATATVPGKEQLYPHAPPGGDGPALPQGTRISVPVGVLGTKTYQPPREWAERSYGDLRRWSVAPSGGHFLAMEEPELLVAELQRFFRDLR